MASLNPVLTIGRQLTEALELHLGMNKEQARQRAAAFDDGRSEAADRLDDYPHQLWRHAPARDDCHGPVVQPQVLIADEPTTALDVTIEAQIVDLVKRLRDEIGMAVIWMTHDLGVVAGFAERVVVMYAGFIVEESGQGPLRRAAPSIYHRLAGVAAAPGRN